MRHMRDTFIVITATALLVLLLAYAAQAQVLNTYIGTIEVFAGETSDAIEEIILVGETEEYVINAEGLGSELIDYAGKNVVINGLIVRDDEGITTLVVKEYFVE